MTNLMDVYESGGTTPRRVYAGMALVLAGAALAVLGVLVATTDLGSRAVGNQYDAIKLAGILAGLAVPVVLVGVFTVLPSGRRIRAAAAIGASLCLFGVMLFWHAYPAHWRGYGDELTLHVSVVYLTGLFIAIWCLFTAVVNFKTRNDPGGMLEMNVTRQGQTKVVEADTQQTASGVGLLGGQPDGDVETQTGQSTRPSSTHSTASDGGAAASNISSPLDTETTDDGEIVDPPTESPSMPADRYCGNCDHFQYARSSSGMVPYCGYHEEAMDDMDACDEWSPNNQ